VETKVVEKKTPQVFFTGNKITNIFVSPRDFHKYNFFNFLFLKNMVNGSNVIIKQTTQIRLLARTEEASCGGGRRAINVVVGTINELRRL